MGSEIPSRYKRVVQRERRGREGGRERERERGGGVKEEVGEWDRKQSLGLYERDGARGREGRRQWGRIR